MPERAMEVIVPQVSMRSSMTTPAVDAVGKPIPYSSVVTEGVYTFILDKPLVMYVDVPLDATDDVITVEALKGLHKFMSDITACEARRRLAEMQADPITPQAMPAGQAIPAAPKQYQGL